MNKLILIFSFFLSITFSAFLFPISAFAQEKVPVIIVPGFLASWSNDLFIKNKSKADDWQFTLGDRTYTALISSLEDEGYVLGQNLFVAFYDWRQSNLDNYQRYLVPIIDEALLLNPEAEQVDIIAHSMGGLFTQGYLRSADYRDDVRHFIMVAVPNHGSADAYYLWGGGDLPPSFKGREAVFASLFLFYRMLPQDMNTWTRKQVIRADMPSVAELLPVYDYLVDFDTGLLLPVSGMTDQNPLLTDWSTPESLLTLADYVDQVSVISGQGVATIDKIAVDSFAVGGRWADGKPIKNGIAYNQLGDGTVLGRSAMIPLIRPNWDCLGGPPPVLVRLQLVKSAQACQPYDFVFGEESWQWFDLIDQRYIYGAGHRDIVTKAIPAIQKTLNQAYIPGVIYEVEDEPDDVLVLAVASPINVKVTDPAGKVLSWSQNDFGDQAMYIADSDPLGPKMLVINNPASGTYQITTVGTGEGAYNIGIIKNDTKDIVPIGLGEESLGIPIVSGETSFGQASDLTIEVYKDGLLVEGELYGSLPNYNLEPTEHILIKEFINQVEYWLNEQKVSDFLASVLIRSMRSRQKQLDARDSYIEKEQNSLTQITLQSIKQQLQSSQSYLDYMHQLKQIDDDAWEDLSGRITDIFDKL